MQIKSIAKNLLFLYFSISPILFKLVVLYVTAYVLNYYSKPLFHTSYGLISSTIALSVFLLAWNGRSIIKNNFLMYLSIGFLFVGILDFVYALNNREFGLFSSIHLSLEDQFWISSRYLLAITFLGSVLFIRRSLNYFGALVLTSLGFVLILISILIFRTFPSSYEALGNVSAFVVTSELIIASIFVLSVILLQKNSKSFDKRVFNLLTTSFLISAFTDIIFSLNISLINSVNILGHTFKVLSYYYVYKAIIEVGLSEPYKLLFHEIDKINQRKDEFLSIASHEIKGPITSIMLYSQLLEDGLAGEKKYTQLANKINKEARKISNMVNELLDLSKIDNNEIIINSRFFSLNSLINEIIEKQTNLSKVTIEVAGNDKECVVFCDKEKIEQVFENLLNNAIKYSKNKAPVKVNISKNSDDVVVSVQDYGIGIPENSQQDIFKKFYRTEISSEKAEGLGIGLYISKGIIERHNGKIWFESEEGRGSIFYFSLPVVKSKT